MTKEEQKADELINRFERLLNPDSKTYKCTECIDSALICVDEIIKEHEINSHIEGFRNFNVEFWQSVKQHILNKGKF